MDLAIFESLPGRLCSQMVLKHGTAASFCVARLPRRALGSDLGRHAASAVRGQKVCLESGMF